MDGVFGGNLYEIFFKPELLLSDFYEMLKPLYKVVYIKCRAVQNLPPPKRSENTETEI